MVRSCDGSKPAAAVRITSPTASWLAERVNASEGVNRLFLSRDCKLKRERLLFLFRSHYQFDARSAAVGIEAAAPASVLELQPGMRHPDAVFLGVICVDGYQGG